MATQYTWIISQLECYPEFDNYQNIVFNVFWNCVGEDIVNNVSFVSSINSSISVQLDPTAPYIPYADLTQDEVLNWVWTSGVDKDATEAEVDAKVQALVNPTVVSPPLPWLPTPTPV
jgi:hypothetical protein